MYKLQLKELRKKAGFKTQEDIADYLGMKLRKYQTWERGEVALTLEDAYMLCVALKCTPNDLCGWPKGLNDDSEPLTSEEMEIVEPSINRANTVISLETCYLQINRNWFAVIGNLQNTR